MKREATRLFEEADSLANSMMMVELGTSGSISAIFESFESS
tara:strand:- start:1132 stop:1254 length:123 start_codon:yes stop_codon:yes gene_type:complete